MRTIVIDAGHGGAEEGARGPGGTLEKDVTLSVARRLKAALEARLGLRVILTRDRDEAVALDERAAVANNNKADMFLSLHANASVRASAGGAEVFYLSLADYGDEAQRVAQGEGEALPVFGGGTRDIEVILWEMAQARYIEQSALLARMIESGLRARVPMSPRAIQQAPFRVLVGANMPAVLVEMGFISNPEQEKQLASDDVSKHARAGSRRQRCGVPQLASRTVRRLLRRHPAALERGDAAATSGRRSRGRSGHCRRLDALRRTATLVWFAPADVGAGSPGAGGT